MTTTLTGRLNIIASSATSPNFIDKEGTTHLEKSVLTFRTPFQPEPVVGHRKISLLKLYNRVVELGGYDWVTESKGLGIHRDNKLTSLGEWRKMTIPYNLPPSCTNGGFQLKTHYYKYLAYASLHTERS